MADKKLPVRVRVGDIRLESEERELLYKLIESERLSESSMTKEFEKLWAEYNGVKHCVAVNSGTSALIAGVYALLYDDRFPKVKKGAKVITSPITYIATSNAIVIAGLEPVFVDIDPITFKLNVSQIQELLKASNPDEYCMILPVHLMGYMNDMDELMDICKRYDLVLFEDAAQAHGSLYNGKKAGSFGLLADFSFYIAHNIQAGEMGAVITSDSKLYKTIKRVKSNGRVCACETCTRSLGICPYSDKDFDPRFTHDFVGFNFKINEFQAAIAIPQIKRVDDIIKKRQNNVKKLNQLLSPFSDKFNLPLYSDSVSYLAYPLILKKEGLLNREFFRRELEAMGIENRPLFGSIPTQQPAFSYLKSKYNGKLPNADYVGSAGLYIGCHQYLTDDDLLFVAETIEKVLQRIA